MRRLVVALALAAACAPATPGVTAPARGPHMDRAPGGVMKGEITIHIEPDRSTINTRIPEPVERVWTAAQEAYRQLGIPVTSRDDAGHVLGNLRFAPGRRLLEERLSAFLHCTEDQMGARVADTHRVTIDVRTAVVAAPLGSEVRTAVVGEARPVSGTSNSLIACTSTGRLERRIATAIQLVLSGAPAR
jgi:hypothetical protein